MHVGMQVYIVDMLKKIPQSVVPKPKEPTKADSQLKHIYPTAKLKPRAVYIHTDSTAFHNPATEEGNKETT